MVQHLVSLVVALVKGGNDIREAHCPRARRIRGHAADQPAGAPRLVSIDVQPDDGEHQPAPVMRRELAVVELLHVGRRTAATAKSLVLPGTADFAHRKEDAAPLLLGPVALPINHFDNGGVSVARRRDEGGEEHHVLEALHRRRPREIKHAARAPLAPDDAVRNFGGVPGHSQSGGNILGKIGQGFEGHVERGEAGTGNGGH